MYQNEISDMAKDLISKCHEAGAEAIVLVGFKDGDTIRAADGPFNKVMLLMGIGLMQFGKQMNEDPVELAKDLLACVKKIKKDMDNRKWKGPDDLGGRND